MRGQEVDEDGRKASRNRRASWRKAGGKEPAFERVGRFRRGKEN